MPQYVFEPNTQAGSPDCKLLRMIFVEPEAAQCRWPLPLRVGAVFLPTSVGIITKRP